MKTKSAFFMFLIIFILVSSVRASSTLTITVATSSQQYLAGEDIEIFGNLTLNGLPVQALVALQINDPRDSPIILRTLQTGEDYEVGSFELLSFYSCDFYGNPKTTFEAGTLAYFKMSVKNTGNTTQYVLSMANAYDSSDSNLGLSAGAFVPVMGGTVLTRISSLYIPTSASLGNATAYVSALTNWPIKGGVPYCPEMSTQFKIISQQGLGGQSSPAQGSQIAENGTYNLTFKLLTDARLGSYTVCVSSTYQGEEATESTTFNLSEPLFVHDVAILTVTPNATKVVQGSAVNITVVARNEGIETESFNVTAYANTAEIETQDITDLGAGAQTTLSFIWDTTGVSLGNYTIMAVASTVPNETDTADNTRFDGTVKVMKLPVADANGPYLGYEGSPITFDATASADVDGTIVLYEWDWENDGIYDENTTSPFINHTWTDDYTGTIGLRVTDDDGLTDTATASVTVENVAPTVNAGTDQIVNEGDLVNFSGSFTDPSLLDTHTIFWDFGDRSNTTETLTPTHVYTEAGVYTVALSVTDDDGGVGLDTLNITVSIVEVHDIAIINVVPPSTLEVDVGGSVDIDVIVKNKGNVEESFTVKLYADVDLIGTETATLAAGANGTYTFTWDTADVALGRYTIKAEVPPVGGETETADNIVTTEWGIEVIPEFPPTLVPFLLLIATLAATLLGKRYSKRRIRKP